MDIEQLQWLQKVLPSLFNSLKHLTNLEVKVPRLKRKRPTVQALGQRRVWVKPENLKRDTDGLFATTFEHLYLENHEEFQAQAGLTPQVFDMLFCLVSEQLNKNSIRTPISAECRLFLTLNYLVQGERVRNLAKAYKMGPSTVRSIVQETCHILWTILSPAFLPQPSTEDWRTIAEGYQQKYHLPHCLGAVDVQLLDISYRGDHCLVVLASCDTNLMFTNFDIGRIDNNQLQWLHDFGSPLFNHQLVDLLPSEPLEGDETANQGYCFVANASFPMCQQLICPFSDEKGKNDQVKFNQQLTLALEGSIEKAFGLLMKRWRVLAQTMHMSPLNAEKILRATIVLHNFLKQHDETYCTEDFLAKELPSSDKASSLISDLLQTVEPVGKNCTAWKLREGIKRIQNNESWEPKTFEALMDSVEWTD